MAHGKGSDSAARQERPAGAREPLQQERSPSRSAALHRGPENEHNADEMETRIALSDLRAERLQEYERWGRETLDAEKDRERLNRLEEELKMLQERLRIEGKRTKALTKQVGRLEQQIGQMAGRGSEPERPVTDPVGGVRFPTWGAKRIYAFLFRKRAT